jgi:DNA-binding transcriptional ArsR family regulator
MSSDREHVRAALLALLDSLAEPTTITVHNTHLNATLQWPGRRPQAPSLVPGSLRAQLYAFLEEAEHRLTLGLLLDALQKAGRDISSRTVENELREMREAELVDNDRKADPPGYGIRGRNY